MFNMDPPSSKELELHRARGRMRPGRGDRPNVNPRMPARTRQDPDGDATPAIVHVDHFPLEDDRGPAIAIERSDEPAHTSTIRTPYSISTCFFFQL